MSIIEANETFKQTDLRRELRGEFRDLKAKHEMTHRLASREHPQVDGLAERLVRTMRRGLRKCLLHGEGQQWDRLLPYIDMGCRLLRQKSIGYSQFFSLVFSH